jgi:hypothetical protein
MGKPMQYAKVPDYFDETKHYIEQLEPVDMGDYLFIDIVVKDLDLSDEHLEVSSGNTDFTPYIPELTPEERIKELEGSVMELTSILTAVIGGGV